jgi:hypothetical protein
VLFATVVFPIILKARKKIELSICYLYNKVLSTAFKLYFIIQGRESHQLNLQLKNSQPVQLKLGTKVQTDISSPLLRTWNFQHASKLFTCVLEHSEIIKRLLLTWKQSNKASKLAKKYKNSTKYYPQFNAYYKTVSK